MPFEDATKDEVRETLLYARARDIIQLIRLLVSQVGKEKAKELIRKSRWEDHYNRGKEAAEEHGMAQDLEGYFNIYFGNEMPKLPFLSGKDLSKCDEKTENRIVLTVKDFCIGRAIAELGDDEIREIGKEAYCIHDIAWAKGFNPKINCTITKIYYDGHDRCQFLWEMEK